MQQKHLELNLFYRVNRKFAWSTKKLVCPRSNKKFVRFNRMGSWGMRARARAVTRVSSFVFFPREIRVIGSEARGDCYS